MGYYINPPSMTKEQFLTKFGLAIAVQDALEHDFSSDTLPVCLIDNVAFTAAGIGYSPAEVDAFAQPDGRPRSWFLVAKSDLKPYYNPGI